MDKNGTQAINPFAILKKAAILWGRNLVPVVALFGLNVFLAVILRSVKTAIEALPPSFFVYVLSGFGGLLILVLHSFVVLTAICYLKDNRRTKTPLLTSLRDAGKALLPYLRAVFLLLVFIFVLLGISFLFFVVGNIFYNTSDGPINLKMGLVLATSTVVVILLIAAAWYGFLFLLAPLIAAFENQGPWASMCESRRRIRGNALRLLATSLMMLVLYVVAGLAVYFIATRFTHARSVLNMVDPLTAVLMGPLWLAAWLVSYETLSPMRQN